MANPVIVDCPADTWTKVATNVTTGQIHKKKYNAKYIQTYVLTGQAAPTNNDLAVPIFTGGCSSAAISAASAIDVYLKPLGIAGSVRVDT